MAITFLIKPFFQKVTKVNQFPLTLHALRSLSNEDSAIFPFHKVRSNPFSTRKGDSTQPLKIELNQDVNMVFFSVAGWGVSNSLSQGEVEVTLAFLSTLTIVST